MVGTGLAILSLATSALATAKSAQENKRTKQMLQRRADELDLEYQHDYNQDYFDTAQAQSAITLLKQKYLDAVKRSSQGAAITGASDEARVAGVQGAQRPYSESITRLAAYGDDYKNSIRGAYLSRSEHLKDLMYGNQMAKGQNWANLGSNAMNALIGVSQADALGSFDSTDEKIKNLFNMAKKGKAMSDVSLA